MTQRMMGKPDGLYGVLHKVYDEILGKKRILSCLRRSLNEKARQQAHCSPRLGKTGDWRNPFAL